jgi:predicted RNase H-like HicB family nuclease
LKRAFSRFGGTVSRYLIILEKGESNYSAYVPDLPGCVATGRTYEEVEKNMREALILHLKGMIEDQKAIPPPQTSAEYIDVSLPPSGV